MSAADFIKRAQTSSSYYEALGLAKNCSESEVKKAYRTIARAIHPDKCQLDGAEDAFKKVSGAYKCLSSADTRRTYDMTGSDTDGASGFGGGGGMPGGIDPNEIFAQFFSQNPEMAAAFGDLGGAGGPRAFRFGGGMPGGMGGGVHFSNLGGGFPGFMGKPRQRSRGGSRQQQDQQMQQEDGLELPEWAEPIVNVLQALPWRQFKLPLTLLVLISVYKIVSALMKVWHFVLMAIFLVPGKYKAQVLVLLLVYSLFMI
jgi:curved DNA-binding protein CbpA